MLVDVLVPLGKRVLKEKFYALKSTFIQNKNTEKSEQISEENTIRTNFGLRSLEKGGKFRAPSIERDWGRFLESPDN